MGYLLGMGAAWTFCTGLAALHGVEDRGNQVTQLHWILLVIQMLVLISVWQAFNRDQLKNSNDLESITESTF